jgi:hypothetical protein
MREVEFRKGFNVPSLKLQRKNSKMHSLSKSSSSKRQSYSSWNFGYSTESRSLTPPTGAITPSCILNCWYENDNDYIKWAMNCPLSNKNMAPPTGARTPSCMLNCWYENDDDIWDAMTYPLSNKNMGSPSIYADIDHLRGDKDDCGVEVIAQGTKLMATILLPTIIIKTENMKLYNSTLYYLILEAKSGPCFEEITCLMFSSPNNSKRTLQTAELLPLRRESPTSNSDHVPLVPLLIDQYYRPIFEIGCTFKVMAVEQGRCLNLKSRKWKNYDLANSEIHLLIRRLLCLDINQIPRIFTSSKPLLGLESRLQNYLTVKQESYTQQKYEIGLSYYKVDNPNTNLLLHRRSKRHPSFSKFLRSPPANERVNKDDESDHTIKLCNDISDDIIELNDYVSLSVTI